MWRNGSNSVNYYLRSKNCLKVIIRQKWYIYTAAQLESHNNLLYCVMTCSIFIAFTFYHVIYDKLLSVCASNIQSTDFMRISWCAVFPDLIFTVLNVSVPFLYQLYIHMYLFFSSSQNLMVFLQTWCPLTNAFVIIHKLVRTFLEYMGTGDHCLQHFSGSLPEFFYGEGGGGWWISWSCPLKVMKY